MDGLHPVQRGGRVRKLANAVVEHALALADAAEVEPEGREAAPHEGLVEGEHDRIVHRAAALRMRMQDQSDGRAGAGTRVETAFETAFGAGKNDFGHSTDPESGGRRAGCWRRLRSGLYRDRSQIATFANHS